MIKDLRNSKRLEKIVSTFSVLGAFDDVIIKLYNRQFDTSDLECLNELIDLLNKCLKANE